VLHGADKQSWVDGLKNWLGKEAPASRCAI
jgi:hypothetical protein